LVQRNGDGRLIYKDVKHCLANFTPMKVIVFTFFQLQATGGHLK